MTGKYKKQKNSLILLIVSSLFIFASTAVYFIYEKEKALILSVEEQKLNTEVELLGSFLKDSLLKRNYAEAKNFLRSWLEQKKQVRKLEVTFSNGHTLFKIDHDCINEMAIKKEFSVGNKSYSIFLTHSIIEVQEHIDELRALLFIVVLLFTAIVGTTLWFVLSHWILEPLKDEIDEQTKVISNKKQLLEKINRSYEALSECNLSLLEAKSEQELLDNICNIIYEKNNYLLVWIGYSLNNKEKNVKVMASQGDDQGYLEKVDVYWSDCERGNGPTGKSIRERRSIVINDTQSDPYFIPWKENAKSRGYNSSAAIPIAYKGQVFGAISVYAPLTNAFLDEEMQLLRELASNLAFGLVSLRQRKEIERTAITDGLTNIFNRRYFDDRFPKIVQAGKRDNVLICFLIMDVDHFKQYNDNYGHQKGDDVLRSVALTLQNSMKRANDYCFRLGGEEFGVLFRANTKEGAYHFADSIRKSIENLNIEHKYSSAADYITASMGLVCKRAKEIDSVDSIYKEADDMLYEAKETGRNKVVVN